jgi:hypothetical protein
LAWDAVARRLPRQGRFARWLILERLTIGLRTFDTSPKRKRVHAFWEFTRLRFGLVGICFVSICAQTNREVLYPKRERRSAALSLAHASG